MTPKLQEYNLQKIHDSNERDHLSNPSSHELDYDMDGPNFRLVRMKQVMV